MMMPLQPFYPPKASALGASLLTLPTSPTALDSYPVMKFSAAEPLLVESGYRTTIMQTNHLFQPCNY